MVVRGLVVNCTAFLQKIIFLGEFVFCDEKKTFLESLPKLALIMSRRASCLGFMLFLLFCCVSKLFVEAPVFFWDPPRFLVDCTEEESFRDVHRRCLRMANPQTVSTETVCKVTPNVRLHPLEMGITKVRTRAVETALNSITKNLIHLDRIREGKELSVMNKTVKYEKAV